MPCLWCSYLHDTLHRDLQPLCFPLTHLFQPFLLLKFFSSVCYLVHWWFICCLYCRILFLLLPYPLFLKSLWYLAKLFFTPGRPFHFTPKGFFSFIFFLKTHLYLISVKNNQSVIVSEDHRTLCLYILEQQLFKLNHLVPTGKCAYLTFSQTSLVSSFLTIQTDALIEMRLHILW